MQSRCVLHNARIHYKSEESKLLMEKAEVMYVVVWRYCVPKWRDLLTNESRRKTYSDESTSLPRPPPSSDLAEES